MFPKRWLVLPRAQHLWRKQNVPWAQKSYLQKHFLCPRGVQQCRRVLSRTGNVGHNVAATMCRRFAGALQVVAWIVISAVRISPCKPNLGVSSSQRIFLSLSANWCRSGGHCGNTLSCRAVTSILSQRLLHCDQFKAVLIVPIHAR